MFYQNIDDLIEAVTRCNPSVRSFDTSCFNGKYVTGDITSTYLEQVDIQRNEAAKERLADADLRDLDICEVTDIAAVGGR